MNDHNNPNQPKLIDSTLKTYMCPVVLTVTGYVTFQAINMSAARTEVRRLNSEGVDQDDIIDPTTESELDLSELEEL